MIYRYSDKDPLEVIVCSMDFVDILNGEAIQSCSWVITREDLPTEVTSGMLSGVASAAGTIVSQKVINGNVGGAYIHRAEVVTPTRTLILGARQNVTFGA